MQPVRKLRGREIPLTHTSSRKRGKSKFSEGLGFSPMERQENDAGLQKDLTAAAEVGNAGGEDSSGGRQADGIQERDQGDSLQPPPSALTLQKAFEVVHDKYQKLKARKLDQEEKLLEEQKGKTAAYSKATEELIEVLRKDNLWLRHLVEASQIQETINRVKELEKENALFKNELLMARAKDHQAVVVREDRHRFLQKLFQSLGEMEIIEEPENSSSFVFQHQPTGLKFALEPTGDADIAKVCGNDREVKFRVISLGTLLNVAPEWMRESITFSMSQASVFFRRLGAVANGL